MILVFCLSPLFIYFSTKGPTSLTLSLSLPPSPFIGSILTESILQIIAAHICYLVAEANIEPYSESARMCLIGADHWKFPRTYASPEAIQVFYYCSVSSFIRNMSFILIYRI